MKCLVIAATKALAVVLLAGCPGESTGEDRPAGTHSDPVERCERLAEVCRLSKSQLGVCVRAPSPLPAACGDRDPCYVCAPQH